MQKLAQGFMFGAAELLNLGLHEDGLTSGTSLKCPFKELQQCRLGFGTRGITVIAQWQIIYTNVVLYCM